MKNFLRFIVIALAMSAAAQTIYTAHADRSAPTIDVDSAELIVADYMTAIRAARKTGQPLILSAPEKEEFENALDSYMKQNRLKEFKTPSERLKESMPDKPGV